MKNILSTILILASTIVSSQEYATTDAGKRVLLHKNGTYTFVKNQNIEATLLVESDIVIRDDRAIVTKKPFYISNGDKKPVLAELSFSTDKDRYSAIKIADINAMLITANIKTMFQIKNRSTYVPKKITLFFSEKANGWLVSIDYIAKNDYGVEKDGTAYSTFDALGVFKDIVIP